jgi:hypothetical protein
MMQSKEKITRANAMDIIRRFAKEYRKTLGKAPGEIIIVGGGSIMLNYKFRDATQDFDVILRAASGIKDVISRFADDNNLPNFCICERQDHRPPSASPVFIFHRIVYTIGIVLIPIIPVPIIIIIQPDILISFIVSGQRVPVRCCAFASCAFVGRARCAPACIRRVTFTCRTFICVIVIFDRLWCWCGLRIFRLNFSKVL